MRKIRASTLGIDQGNDEVFSDFGSGGDMWTGSGARERRKKVAFSEPFSAIPSVQVSLSLWDVDSAANVRADLTSENVTETGFELVFRTWGDSRIARVRMSWLAVGAVKSEDDWELY